MQKNTNATDVMSVVEIVSDLGRALPFLTLTGFLGFLVGAIYTYVAEEEWKAEIHIAAIADSELFSLVNPNNLLNTALVFKPKSYGETWETDYSSYLDMSLLESKFSEDLNPTSFLGVVINQAMNQKNIVDYIVHARLSVIEGGLDDNDKLVNYVFDIIDKDFYVRKGLSSNRQIIYFHHHDKEIAKAFLNGYLPFVVNRIIKNYLVAVENWIQTVEQTYLQLSAKKYEEKMAMIENGIREFERHLDIAKGLQIETVMTGGGPLKDFPFLMGSKALELLVEERKAFAEQQRIDYLKYGDQPAIRQLDDRMQKVSRTLNEKRIMGVEIEKPASIPTYPEKPKLIPNLIATTLIGILFGAISASSYSMRRKR